MSVEYAAIICVGFKVTQEEVDKMKSMLDEEEFFDVYDEYLVAMDGWADSCDWIFYSDMSHVGEGDILSASDLLHKVDYEKYKDFIATFNKYFPFVDKETHQLDVWIGLRVY